MVWPNNYRTFPGWIPNKLRGRQDYGSYKMGLSGDRLNRFINENVPQTSSTPTGYYSPSWQVPPIKAGGMSSYLALHGAGEITADVLAVRLALANITGTGDLTAQGGLIVRLVAELIGSGEITNADFKAFLVAVASITGSGDVAASISGLAALTAALSGVGNTNATEIGIGALSADIVSFGELSVEGMREAVWSALASQYNNPGTMGEKLNNAASAGDPWSTVLPGSYSGAQAGKILDKIQALITELHKIQGLDSDNPATTTPNSVDAGTIHIDITGDGINSTTFTRND